jgi:hypothetical protein
MEYIRYDRACGPYREFHDRSLIRTSKQEHQEFLVINLSRAPRMFYGRRRDLVNCYGISVSQLITDMFCLT